LKNAPPGRQGASVTGGWTGIRSIPNGRPRQGLIEPYKARGGRSGQGKTDNQSNHQRCFPLKMLFRKQQVQHTPCLSTARFYTPKKEAMQQKFLIRIESLPRRPLSPLGPGSDAAGAFHRMESDTPGMARACFQSLPLDTLQNKLNSRIRSTIVCNAWQKKPNWRGAHNT
jgi:hypothetical protein